MIPRRTDSHGVFQMEATFAKRILIDMQPRSLEDLGVAVALNRPGPIEGGATDLYIKRKRGELPVEYPEDQRRNHQSPSQQR